VTRAVLLGRVSTSDRRRNERTGEVRQQDTENQLIPLRAAAARLGWTVAVEIPLPGLSAWEESDAAEVRRRVLEPFRQGAADVLMCWSLDRVVRGGIAEAFAFLRTLERDLGVGFWSLQEPFLNTTADPQQRELMVALLSWVARWESQRRSDRLKAKAEASRNRAGAGGGRARWGRGRLPTHEDQARIRALVASGKTYRAVQQEVGFSLSTISKVVRSQTDEQVPLADGAATLHREGEETNSGGS